MKTIWARIGMSLEVTDEEYEYLKNHPGECEGDVSETDDDNNLFKRFVKDGYIDGDCYIPDEIWED